MRSTRSGWKIGDRIKNRWEVHRISKGGMGVVYIVHDAELDDLFAAKTFQDRLFDIDPNAMERFRRESLTWINIEPHTNVTKAHFVEVILGKPYLFLEYVDGGDLGGWIGTPRLTEDLPRLLRFGIEFCDGIIHALSGGIRAHRDIKPQNCLITDGGTLKVTDFGLAKVLDEDASREPDRAIEITHHFPADFSRTGQGAGTITHMAPEQFDDAKHVDVRADIYSFGVMLYQMVTGRLPFLIRAMQREAWELYRNAHKRERPPSVDARFAALGTVIEKCLAKDPTARFSDFRGVRDELEQEYARRTGQPFVRSLQEPSAGPAEWITRVGSLTRLGRYDDALRYADRALATRTEQVAAWNNKGIALIGAGRYEEALECLGHSIQLDSTSWRGWHNKGGALIALGRRGEALACFDRSIELEPRDPNVWYSKGQALDDESRFEEALICFDRALELDPHLIPAWSGKAQSLDDLERADEALACFDHALELQPDEPWTLFNKGITLARLGRQDDALICFDCALDVHPRLTAAWYQKGKVLLLKGQPDKALACFDQTLLLNPLEARALRGKARALGELGTGARDLLPYLDRAIELDANDSEAWALKAGSLSQLQCFDESLRCFDRALELDPSNALAWFGKGVVLYHLDREKDALQCLLKARRLDFPVEEAIREIGRARKA